MSIKHLIKNSLKLKIILSAILLLLLTSGYIYFCQHSLTNKAQVPTNETSNEEIEVIEADLLGKGEKQTINIIISENTITLEVLDDGKKVTNKTFYNGRIRPALDYSTVQLDSNNPKEYIRWDQVAGPHQFETFIITVYDNHIFSLASLNPETATWYEPFWTNRDRLVIGDIDGDGFAEIIEFVDEYPPNAQKLEDAEIEDFTKKEIEEYGDDMWTIVARENYGSGRGRKVIWNIHSFTYTESGTPIIIKLVGEEFEETATKLINTYQNAINDVEETELSEIISVTQLEQNSIDFNNFVRDFWTLGQPYERPIKKY
jgi:hypothetical protein